LDRESQICFARKAEASVRGWGIELMSVYAVSVIEFLGELHRPDQRPGVKKKHVVRDYFY
jgi:hypothetical protein